MWTFGFLISLALANRNEIQTLTSRMVTVAPVLDGSLDDFAWGQAESTKSLVDIHGFYPPVYPMPKYQTLVKVLYDPDYLYIGAKIAEPHVWTYYDTKNTRLYQQNAFEVFLDPDGDGLNYYELELNALNTIWELSLDKAYSAGGTPRDPDNIPGLVTAVKVQGTLNDPSDVDAGWSAEIAIPWAGLSKFNNGKGMPKAGDSWRVNFSRTVYTFDVVDGKYVGKNVTFYAWSSMKGDSIHDPTKWGIVNFVG